MIPVTIGSIFLTIESPPDSFRPIGPRAQTNRHGKSFTMCVKTFNFFQILYFTRICRIENLSSEFV